MNNLKLKGKAFSYYKDFLLLFFSALSLLLSLFNNILGFPTGFGMTVDLSAVPIFLTLFLFSYRDSLKVLSLFSISLLFFSPSGFIGAIMKFVATLPLILIPYFGQNLKTTNFLIFIALLSLILVLSFSILSNIFILNSFLSSLFLIIFSIIPVKLIEEKKFIFSKRQLLFFTMAILLRAFLMTVLNIYFAGPLFFKISPDKLIEYVESFELPLIGKSSIFFIIGFWNSLQSIVEVGIAFLLFNNKLIKRRFLYA